MKPKSFLRNFLLLTGSIVLTLSTAHATDLYWDGNSTTIGAGVAPVGTWGTSIFWNTDSTGGSGGALQSGTLITDDLFFSAGSDARNAYTISLTSTRSARSLTFEEGNVTISGTGGKITLGGTGSIRVNGGLTATIGNNTTTVLDSTVGLTKSGTGTLIISNTASNTISGGLFLNGGTLSVERSGNSTFTAGNALTFAGGTLVMKTALGSTLDQNFGNVTVNAGGGTLQVHRNGTVRSQSNLGTITATAAGGSLLLASTSGTGNSGVITTASTNDATGILGGRIIYSNGTAGTGMDFATITTGTTVGAYASYTAMPLAGGSSTVNYSTSAGGTLSGALAVNTLKIVGSATALALGGNTLTVASGGLLSTGTTAQIISGTTGATRLTAGAGLGGTADLVIHQYNSAGGGLTISAVIGDNTAGSGNAVNLVKAGTGYLGLSGANTYTGSTYVNSGILDFGATTPSGSGANIFVAPGALVKFGAPTQTLLNRIAATTEEFGVLTSTGSSGALDFTNHPNAFLAGGYASNSAKTDNVSHTITPANNQYRLGYVGANGSFGVHSVLTGATNGLLVGGNNVILTNVNTFGGETQVRTGARLVLANTLALQNSALNLGTGADSIQGTFSLYAPGNITNATSITTATLGGLIGSRSLFSAYSTAGAGNNSAAQAVTAITGFTLNVGLGQTLIYTGAIGGFGTGAAGGLGGNSTLTKTGAGTQILGGISTYTGATTVSGGILAVNGSLANTSTTVQNTGTLQGSGSIAGSVSVQGGGTLASGNSIESLATGTLSLEALSTFAYELDRNAPATVAGDLTAVTGNLNITNTAILTLTELGGAGSWTMGEELTLISYTGAWGGGLFDYLGSPLADNSVFTFSGMNWLFNYNDTTPGTNFTGDLTGTSFVTMTAIPEPSAALLGGLGALLLLRRRR